MSKGGGGFDTSGIEAAARESNALQKQMYEESVARGQPFYEGGLGGFKTLLDYLGLEGGNARQSRESIYSELAPQYTRQETVGSGMPNLFVNDKGEVKVFGDSGANALSRAQQYELDKFGLITTTDNKGINYNWKPYSTQTTKEVTDTDALNAAIEARLAQQEDAGVPSYFGSLLQPFSMDKFEADPSYQFRQAEGQKAIERAMAARGQSFTPAAIQALQGYNQDLASQEFGNAFNRYNIDQGNIYNRLAGIAGMGQQQIGQLNQAGQTYASNVGATNASLAQSQLAAQQAAAANRGSMFNNLLATAGQIGAAYFMGSDIRIKENIEHVGEQNGYNLYDFNYKGDDIRYRGVMAQEVQLKTPDAVKDIDGVLHVNYDAIGLKMEVV